MTDVKLRRRITHLGKAMGGLIADGFVVAISLVALAALGRHAGSVYPHVLMGLAVVIALTKETLADGTTELQPNDKRVLWLFGIGAAGLYYSEIPFVSWLHFTLIFDAVALYTIARLTFSRYAGQLPLAIPAVLLGLYFVAPDNAAISNSLILLFIVASISMVFVIWRRITAVHFFLYVAVLGGGILCYLTFKSAQAYEIAMDLWRNGELSGYAYLHNALKIGANYPLFGCGLGTYDLVATATYGAGGEWPVRSTEFLKYFLEIGAVGTLTVLIVAGSSLREIVSHWARTRSSAVRIRIAYYFFLSFFALIFAMTTSPMTAPLFMLIFFILWGLLFSATHAPQEERAVARHDNASPSLFENLSLGSSLKLGATVALVLIVCVCAAIPLISNKHLSQLAAQPPTAEKADSLTRLTLRVPVSDRAWFELASCLNELEIAQPSANSRIRDRVDFSLNKAIALNLFTAEYFILQAQNAARQNERERLLPILTKAVANNPCDTTLRLMLSRELALRGNNEAAVQNAKNALIGNALSRHELALILCDYQTRDKVAVSAPRYLQYALQGTADMRPNLKKISELMLRTKAGRDLLEGVAR